jgi:hypothetical protein
MKKTSDVIYCFIPCAARKNASGIVDQPVQSITAADLTTYHQTLAGGQQAMNGLYCPKNKALTTALRLYTGWFFHPLRPYLPTILPLLREGPCRIFILSGCYGVIDALDAVRCYIKGPLSGRLARQWIIQHKLREIIAELITIGSPRAVYGFVAGPDDWPNHTQQGAFRYAFEQGVFHARTNGFQNPASSFFVPQQGVVGLGVLGQAFVTFVKNGFNPIAITGHQHGGFIVNRNIL